MEREAGLFDYPERRARFHVWDDECHVHAGIRRYDVAEMRAEHPEAEFLIHPECGCSTETRMRPAQAGGPGAELIAANRMAFCRYVKMIILPKLRGSLREGRVEVKVPEAIAARARVPIERMVAIG